MMQEWVYPNFHITVKEASTSQLKRLPPHITYHICLHVLHLYCFPIVEDAIPNVATEAALFTVVIL